MPITLKRVEKSSRFLDPRENFQEACITSETRFDPLTGQAGLIAHFGMVRLQKPDLQPLIEASLARPCPFCPELVEKVTPKFPPDLVPEGRLRRGQTIIFPNLAPYDEHSAVAVATADHFVALTSFTPHMLSDTFKNCLEYFHHVSRSAGKDFFDLISWNYMPPAGASQVHPHLQLLATLTPWNTLGDEWEASKSYYEQYGSNFWNDLITEEQKQGERYVGTTGNCVWLTSFAPRGLWGDFLAVFSGKASLWDLTEEDIDDFSQGLARVFRYLDDNGIYSFNLGFYPGLPGQHHFWTHVRLVPRFSVQPALHASDVAYIQLLYSEPCSTIWPEEMAHKARPYF